MKKLIVILIMTLLIITVLPISADFDNKEEEIFNYISSVKLDNVLWDNSIQEISEPFGSQLGDYGDLLFDVFVADDFIFDDEASVYGICWIGGYFNFYNVNGPKDYHFPWNITFFEDDGTGYHPGSIFAGPYQISDSEIMKKFLFEIDEPNLKFWVANYIVELPESVVFNPGTKYWISIYGIGDLYPQSFVASHNESMGGIRLNEFNLKSQYWYDQGFYPSNNWFNVSEYEAIYDINFMLLDYPVNYAPNEPSCVYDADNDEIVISTIDLDGDNIRYGVSWDNDGDIDQWTEFLESGEEVRISCEGKEGKIGVIAEDVYGHRSDWVSVKGENKLNMPFGFIFAFGFDVNVKIVQLDPGEDYVDLEVLDKPFYIWENEIITRNPGEFIRLYTAKGLFSPSLPFCFGICNDWSIIG
jgi:hypothetical protein